MSFLSSISSGIGNFFGELSGSNKSAQAAQAGATAQYQAAEDAIKAQEADYQKSLDYLDASRAKAQSLAGPSAQELGQMGMMVDLQHRALDTEFAALKRNQDMLEAADPAVKEAGKQALQLLEGKQAAAIQPMLDQRNRQRSQLEQTLASRMGPDYAQSSAGAQALRNFDNDTSTMTNNVQQQTLGQLLGVAQNTANSLNPVNQSATAFGTLGALNSTSMQAAFNMGTRSLNAFTSTPYVGPPNVNYNPMIQSADYSSIGKLYEGQAQEKQVGPWVVSNLPTRMNNSFQDTMGGSMGKMGGMGA